ncbi:hypothetical protein TL16_g05215 [Triparma laevis f. inornata]|uniref:beta-ketoacyl-[acyl-carrier-protein] synthase I n=1 Tax=Triparma laevis f. inornata TaxID=1714386 RepID=A0A9W7AKY9_9STRA|nr:hypothetical protein TL16_g05215 [Triparma laevis f. inornata]
MPPYLPRRRVVVTSIGAISPLGPTFSTTWSNLLNFTSPIKSVDALSSLPCTVAAAASIPDSSPSNVTSQKSRFLQFAISATNDALSTYTSSVGGITHGISLGSGIGSISTITAAHTLLTTKSHKRLSPHFVPSILSNSSAGVVSKEFNLQGPNTSCSTACATGNHSIIDAYRFIRDGEADLMVAGGSEASIDELSVAGFTRLRALSTGFNDRPEESSRPFDKNRDGFVMGEGACVLFLEDLETVKSRGGESEILAEILGYGVNGDAFHATAPDPSGSGAYRAMARALETAGKSIDDVDYINAHATSTPMGDEIEVKAIQSMVVGRENGRKILVSSTKGATGHLLGAAGALEAAFTVMSLKEGRVVGTKNLKEVDVGEYDEGRIEILKNGEVREVGFGGRGVALNNSFGFGGVNSVIAFGRYDDR